MTFQYEKELKKILKIIGEENYEFHDFNLSMLGKDMVYEVTFSIVVNCPLKKIKKKAKEISELTKDKDFTYTIMLFDECGLDPDEMSETDDKFAIDLDSNFGYTTKKSGKISSIMISNEIADLSEFAKLEGLSDEWLMLDEKDLSGGPFIPYA